jgi:hypothetical protein
VGYNFLPAVGLRQIFDNFINTAGVRSTASLLDPLWDFDKF